jgi:hypothetical protein
VTQLSAESRGLTVVAGDQSVRVNGRAARLIVLLAFHADRINGLTVGRIVANFAHTQLKVELNESLPGVQLGE